MCQNLGVALAGAIGAAGAIVCLGAGQPALGQTVCDSIGPDVIVGEIPGAANYSSVGGIEAFSIGTTACNIGDDILLWADNSTFHPVIGQNMFRLKDARFEQIGQAWLKHGFAALQNDACGCGCSHSGVLDYLNAGCSDPYTAGLNGGQGGVGPKFEVNAYTGDFLWPPTDIDNTGDSIYKRLQVKISDLDPPAAMTLSGGLTGPLGSSGGSGRVRLSRGQDGTRIAYDYTVEIGGKVAAVGGRMLEGAANIVIGQFFARLAAQVGGKPPTESWWRRLLRKLGLG